MGEMEKYETVETISENVEGIKEKKINWLIPGILPEKQLSLIAGDGGAGKGFTWCQVIRTITTGKPFFDLPEYEPFERREPGSVLLLSAEDSISYTVKHRLRMASADLKKVRTVPMEHPAFSEIKFNSELLKREIEMYKPTLCIFDPLQSFVPPNVNLSARNEMRDIMAKLISICVSYGSTPLVVMHTNKSRMTWGRQRIADSADIWDIARSVLIVGNVPGGDGLKYLSHEKSSLGALQDTIQFNIKGDKAVFDSFTYKKDYDFMTGKTEQTKATPAKDEAKTAIMKILRENPEGIEGKELKSEAIENYDISEATYKRALSELNKDQVITKERSGKGESLKSIIKPLLYTF